MSELSRVRDGEKETFSHQPSCLATRPLGAALSCIYKESQRVQVDLIHYLSFSLLFWEEGGGRGEGSILYSDLGSCILSSLSSCEEYQVS